MDDFENNKNRQIFNSALCIENNQERLISAKKLNSMMKKDNTIYKKRLKGHLFCPYCKKVELAIAPIYGTNDYFLRRYPKQEHLSTCIKSYNYVRDKSFETFANDPKGNPFIKSKLELIVKTLCGYNIDPRFVSLVIAYHNGDMIPRDSLEINSEVEEIRQLRIKHLFAPMCADEYDRSIIFYGTVDFEIGLDTYKMMPNIYIYDVGGDHPLCTLSMKNNVAEKIKDMYNLKTNQKYNKAHIAFTAKMKDKEPFGMIGEVVNESYLVIKTK